MFPVRRPLGFAMVGGLIVSRALTLFTTPVIYLHLGRVSQWRQRRKGVKQDADEDANKASANTA